MKMKLPHYMQLTIIKMRRHSHNLTICLIATHASTETATATKVSSKHTCLPNTRLYKGLPRYIIILEMIFWTQTDLIIQTHKLFKDTIMTLENINNSAFILLFRVVTILSERKQQIISIFPRVLNI
jgi:hypothetical protein